MFRSLVPAALRIKAPLVRSMTHYPPKKLIGIPTTTYKHESVRTSPFKLNLIAKLVRRLWVPEALAQLEFSKKRLVLPTTKLTRKLRFAPLVHDAIVKAADRAAIQHELVLEELTVERCFVTSAP